MSVFARHEIEKEKHRMKATRILVAALALAATPIFAADTYVVDKAHSEATFKIRHMMSKVSGKFDDFTGSINIDAKKAAASSVEFTINATSIDTGNENRDKHLRSADFFDVEKTPTITFKSTKVAAGKKKNLYNVTGTLTMHGVSKTVTLPVEFLGFQKDPGGNEKAGFSIDTVLNRKDYGINWNKALDAGGALLSDDVNIEINIEAAKSKAAINKEVAKEKTK
jgi:polyisoprenoid-binding protein YceI